MSATLTIPMHGPAAFRALARAFEQFDNFDQFVAGLQSALDASPVFKHSLIALDQRMVTATDRFPTGALSFPLLGDRGPIGALQAGTVAERRRFSAEDLHLMAGLADFLSAVLGQALRAADAVRTRELFRLLLNQAPVGIAAFTSDGRPLIANDLATRWLGTELPPFEELAAGDGGFHLRTGGKLIYGQARRTDAAAPASDWLVVLHDLTGDQVKLLELMKRETYRALAERRGLGFALVDGGAGEGLLRRLTALRAALRDGEFAGPYDAHRLGLVLGGAGGLALRARLRELRAVFAPGEALRLGYAQLGRDGQAPEALLQGALQRAGGFDELLRPALLIHEENPSVASTLRLVLGRDYRVVASDSAARTRELLDAEPFEGIVAELDNGREQGGPESIVRLARALQPGIRIFLTSVQPAAALPALPDATVIEKPFDVAALTALMREQIGR